jgi:hypothetical protein
MFTSNAYKAGVSPGKLMTRVVLAAGVIAILAVALFGLGGAQGQDLSGVFKLVRDSDGAGPAAGMTMMRAAQKTNSTRAASGHISRNASLLTGSIGVTAKYAAAVSRLEQEVNNMLNTFQSNPQRKTAGLDLWLGANQSTSYVPQALKSPSINCLNQGAPGGLLMPPGLASALPSLLSVYEKLNLGTLNICLSVSSDPSSSDNDLDLFTFRLEGKFNGQTGFARSFHLLMSELCTGDQWNQHITCAPRQNCDGRRTCLWVNEAPYIISKAAIPSMPCVPFQWPSPTFAVQQLISKGYFRCGSGHSEPNAPSVAALFLSYSDPEDTSAALQSMTAAVNGAFASDQQAFYHQVAAAFSGTSAIEQAGEMLTGVNALIKAYSSFGLSKSVQADDLRAKLYGDQALYDGNKVQAAFASFSAAPVVDITHNKAQDAFTTIRGRLNLLQQSLDAALVNVETTQLPEGLMAIDVPLADLRSFQNLQKVGALAAACTYVVSPSGAAFGASSAPGNISVTETNNCTWRANTNVPWITIANDAAVAGNRVVTYFVQANTSASPREGVVIIGDKLVHINQAGL